MFDAEKIGKHIRELRMQNNMTQIMLADELNVSYQAVSNWERGYSMPDISKLEDLSRIFSCTIDELLGASRETETLEKVLVQCQARANQGRGSGAAGQTPAFTEETMNELAESVIEAENWPVLKAIAPFVSSWTLRKAAAILVEKGKLKELESIAPYL